MAATPTVTQGLPGPWPECMTVRGLSGLFSARSVICPVDPLDVSSIPGLTSGGLWVECIFRMFVECQQEVLPGHIFFFFGCGGRAVCFFCKFVKTGGLSSAVASRV